MTEHDWPTRRASRSAMRRDVLLTNILSAPREIASYKTPSYADDVWVVDAPPSPPWAGFSHPLRALLSTEFRRRALATLPLSSGCKFILFHRERDQRSGDRDRSSRIQVVPHEWPSFFQSSSLASIQCESGVSHPFRSRKNQVPYQPVIHPISYD